ncbi:MAG: hypothetical protein AB1689_13845 [Thermodesulfobacteriota bacterium]
MPRSLLVLPLLLLVACESSLADREKEARAALDARDFATAQNVSEAALVDAASGEDAAVAWRLEQIRLDALAHQKQGAEVVRSLERLATEYPAQVTPALYRSVADRLKTAGDTTGAIDVLAAGDKRFPQEHEVFVKDIEALKQGNLDPAQVERLKALGYL